MLRSRMLGAFALVVSVPAFALTASAQPPQTIPIAVEDVRIIPPVREGLPPEVAVTVRNTGTLAIEAWGVAGEVKYANGTTRRIGVSTDTYETMSLPESLQPPAGTSKRLPAGGRATITASVPTLSLVAPSDAAAFPTFAVFDDDSVVGEEALIEYTFARRRVNQRAWRLADETLTSAVTRGLPPEQVLTAVMEALDAADDEVRQSVAVSIVRRSISARPNPEKLQRLRTEIVSRRAAADRHAERHR